MIASEIYASIFAFFFALFLVLSPIWITWLIDKINKKKNNISSQEANKLISLSVEKILKNYE